MFFFGWDQGRSRRSGHAQDHACRHGALLSQKPRQQSFGCLGIAARLNDFVQHIPVLIDGAPKRAFLAIDRDDGLVQTPHVVPARRLALQAARVRGVADLLLQ
jgi:hypothetical protein